MFSRIAGSLNRHSAMTVSELLNLAKASYSPSPQVEQLHFMFNISGWLAPHIENLKHHVYPHSYKFAKDDAGKVGMWYKQWTRDRVWLPEEGPLYILKSIPKGIPSIIPPNSKRLPTIEEMKAKSSKCACRMNTMQIAWWQAFISHEEKLRSSWEAVRQATLKTWKAKDWPLLSLGKHLSPDETACQRNQEDEHMENELSHLMSKQDRFSMVGSMIALTSLFA